MNQGVLFIIKIGVFYFQYNYLNHFRYNNLPLPLLIMDMSYDDVNQIKCNDILVCTLIRFHITDRVMIIHIS